jgi:hypothetical protein
MAVMGTTVVDFMLAVVTVIDCYARWSAGVGHKLGGALALR